MLFQLPGAPVDTHQSSGPSLLASGRIFFSATHLLEEQPLESPGFVRGAQLPLPPTCSFGIFPPDCWFYPLSQGLGF